nr:hypothetical protein CFP56_09812 [Quercus suber]
MCDRSSDDSICCRWRERLYIYVIAPSNDSGSIDVVDVGTMQNPNDYNPVLNPLNRLFIRASALGDTACKTSRCHHGSLHLALLSIPFPQTYATPALTLDSAWRQAAVRMNGWMYGERSAVCDQEPDCNACTSRPNSRVHVIMIVLHTRPRYDGEMYNKNHTSSNVRDIYMYSSLFAVCHLPIK